MVSAVDVFEGARAFARQAVERDSSLGLELALTDDNGLETATAIVAKMFLEQELDPYGRPPPAALLRGFNRIFAGVLQKETRIKADLGPSLNARFNARGEEASARQLREQGLNPLVAAKQYIGWAKQPEVRAAALLSTFAWYTEYVRQHVPEDLDRATLFEEVTRLAGLPALEDHEDAVSEDSEDAVSEDGDVVSEDEDAISGDREDVAAKRVYADIVRETKAAAKADPKLGLDLAIERDASEGASGAVSIIEAALTKAGVDFSKKDKDTKKTLARYIQSFESGLRRTLDEDPPDTLVPAIKKALAVQNVAPSGPFIDATLASVAYARQQSERRLAVILNTPAWFEARIRDRFRNAPDTELKALTQRVLEIAGVAALQELQPEKTPPRRTTKTRSEETAKTPPPGTAKTRSEEGAAPVFDIKAYLSDRKRFPATADSIRQQLRKRLRAEDDLENAIAETFKRALASAASFDGTTEGAAKGWILTIAKNVGLEFGRQRERAPRPTEEIEKAPAPVPESREEPISVEERERFRRAFPQLATEDQKILYPFVLGQRVDGREAAYLLDITYETYRKRLERAKAAVEDVLSGKPAPKRRRRGEDEGSRKRGERPRPTSPTATGSRWEYLPDTSEPMTPASASVSAPTAEVASEAPLVPVEPAPVGSVIPEHLVQAVWELTQDAVPDNTQRTYKSAQNVYARWAAENKLAAFPVVPQTLAAWIAQLELLGRRPSTIQVAVSALISWNKERGAPDPSDNPIVKKTLEGVRQRHGTRPKRQAAPLTPEQLKIFATLTDITPRTWELFKPHQRGPMRRSLRDRAIVLLGFAGALRQSEIVGLNVNDLSFEEDGLRLVVRKSKTDKVGAGAVVKIPRGGGVADPVDAVRRWLDFNEIREGPLFRRVYPGAGRIGRRRLSTRAVEMIVTEVIRVVRAEDPEAVLREIYDYSGHSMRRGFVTAAVRAGKPLIAIAEHGRWEHLNTVKGYYEQDRQIDETNPAWGLL